MPSAVELAHDYLWRIHHAVPGNGEIVIFNRSHYEDVLVVRVHELVPKARWSRRYDQINDFEATLAAEGTTILKFFLHISLDEQLERFRERYEDPTKRWKFKLGDLEERKRWADYMAAYEDVLSRCSTDVAPWFVIPADRKWFRDLAIADIVADTLEDLKPAYPKRADLPGEPGDHLTRSGAPAMAARGFRAESARERRDDPDEDPRGSGRGHARARMGGRAPDDVSARSTCAGSARARSVAARPACPGWLDTSPTLTPEQMQLVDVQLVGNYALAPTWGDGHHTGYYPFAHAARAMLVFRMHEPARRGRASRLRLACQGGPFVIVSTAPFIAGHRVVETKGQTFGLVVRSRGFSGNLIAGLRSLAGGEIHEYTQLLEDTRRQALDRLVKNATLMGANAVISMRFDSSELAGTMSEIVAYGTAVVVEPDASAQPATE